MSPFADVIMNINAMVIWHCDYEKYLLISEKFPEWDQVGAFAQALLINSAVSVYAKISILSVDTQVPECFNYWVCWCIDN